MPEKTREERLFGAACLKLTLEKSVGAAEDVEIYQGSLEDLGLKEDEVQEYLSQKENKLLVQEALETRGQSRN